MSEAVLERPAHLDDFLEVRDRLLHTARRIVGGESDAEDVVQDAWLRWDHTDRTVIRNVPAFLTSTTTRLSINAIQTAYVRHRGSPGEWPVERADRGADPAEQLERTEELRAALLVLVERLTPRECAAFVLREAFGYPHRQIGEALGLTETNTRQLVRRARTRLNEGRGKPAASNDRVRLLAAFLVVSRTGDPAALALLARG
ncbi:sigma-70 family RNA polymerase sigma factor [Actinoplanes solisilvae]|uniref:sigma-70 family RNA polymerase sigma factor n=1 Tax=Actinoplanes solisilvae TaxID=2486853 RepID=UPI000FDB5182|nr:sigma-70 family RNA polymerase sigma factor [Actinoplanes solisilvae]